MTGLCFWCILPLLFAAGMITSVTDVRDGKIYSRHLKLFIIMALPVQSLTAAWLLIAGPHGVITFFPGHFLSNALFSLFTGLGLWLLHLWAAGDVKLFFVFTLLLPPGFFADARVGLFPGFDMLVNMFILATLYVTLEAAASLARNMLGYKKKQYQSKHDNNIKLELKKILSNILIIVFFVLVINQVRDLLVRQFAAVRGIDMLYFYIVLLFLSGTLVRYLQNTRMLLLIAGLLIAYIAVNTAAGNYASLRQLLDMLIAGLAIAGGSMLLGYLLARENDRDIDKDVLQPSMIPSDHFRQLWRKDSRLQHIDRELTMDGLQPDHVALIKKHCPLEKIRIKSGFPFAPFMFAGVLLTLLVRTNLLKMLLAQLR